MSLIKKVIKYTKAVGIEVCFNPDSSITYIAVSIKTVKNRIRIHQISNEENSLESLQTLLPKFVPICIVISGMGVMIKELESSNAFNSFSLDNIIPYANPDDYYMQVSKGKNGKAWVAVMRREQLENVLRVCHESAIYPVELFIGPFTLECSLHLFRLADSYINTKVYLVSVINQALAKIEKSETTNRGIPYEDFTIEEYSLLPLSAAYQFLIINQGQTNCSERSIQRNSNDSTAMHVLKLSRHFIIGLFFCILLLSFLIFYKYNNLITSINQETFQSKSLLTQRKKLEDELFKKKQLVSTSGISKSSNVSFFSDFIASSKPDHIRLDVLEVFPVELGGYNKPIDIKNNIILLKGVSGNNTSINNWINKLMESDFINAVKIIEIKQKNNHLEFALQIEI